MSGINGVSAAGKNSDNASFLNKLSNSLLGSSAAPTGSQDSTGNNLFNDLLASLEKKQPNQAGAAASSALIQAVTPTASANTGNVAASVGASPVGSVSSLA